MLTAAAATSYRYWQRLQDDPHDSDDDGSGGRGDADDDEDDEDVEGEDDDDDDADDDLDAAEDSYCFPYREHCCWLVVSLLGFLSNPAWAVLHMRVRFGAPS